MILLCCVFLDKTTSKLYILDVLQCILFKTFVIMKRDLVYVHTCRFIFFVYFFLIFIDLFTLITPYCLVVTWN